MERALNIPEIVSMIVESLAGEVERTPRGFEPHNTTEVSADLARIARVGQLWWEPATRALYRDVNSYDINQLLKIIDEEWPAADMTPKHLDDEMTRRTFHRFLRYARVVQTMVIEVGEDIEDAQRSSDRCSASAFRGLARLQDLYSPTCCLFPSLRTLWTALLHHVALDSALSLLHPGIESYSAVFSVEASPCVPDFLVAMTEHVPNVTHLSIRRDEPPADSSRLTPAFSNLRRLEECHLHSPTSSYALFETLSRLQQLEELSLDLERNLDTMHPQLHFSRLQELSLDGDRQGLIAFLQGTELPRLSRVTISAQNNSLARWEDVLSALEDRVENLQHLTIDIKALLTGTVDAAGSYRPTSDLLPWRKFPNLKHLIVVEERLDRWYSVGFGFDEETVAAIQAAWPQLETLEVRHNSCVWLGASPPAALSFAHIVGEVFDQKQPLQMARLVVRLSTIPNLKYNRSTATYGCLEVTRVVQARSAKDGARGGKGAFLAAVEWGEVIGSMIISRLVPFNFDCDYDTGVITCSL